MRSILLTLLFFSSLISSAQFVWNGDGDGQNWEDPDNWVSNTAPGANIFQSVTINDATDTVFISTTNTVGYLNVIGSTVVIKSSGRLNLGHSDVSTLPFTLLLELQNAQFIVDGFLSTRSVDPDHIVSLDSGSLLQIGATGYMYTWLTQKGILVNKDSEFRVLSGGLADLRLDSLGITNLGTLTNQGKIDITFEGYGIDNYGVLINEDSLIIDAVSSGGIRGFLNTDSTNNQGYFYIGGSKESGLYSTGELVNESSGYMHIYRYGTSAEPNSNGLYAENLFENKGNLLINSISTFGLKNVKNTTGFLNTGSLEVYSADSLGLLNLGSGVDSSLFHNSSVCILGGGVRNAISGKFLWEAPGEISGSDAFTNTSLAIISDSLVIDAMETGIVNSGHLTIAAPVTIEDSKFGIRNEGNFVIEPTGSIDTGLLTTTLGGYALKNTDYFLNQGILNLPHGNDGLINENSSTGFFNEGTITLSSISSDFIRNEGNGTDSSRFHNSGQIIIHSDGDPNGAKGQGIFNTGKASFINTGEIDQYELWYVFDNIVNESYFRNEGIFDFKETKGININNSGLFESTASSQSTFQCDENFNDFGIFNTGEIHLEGQTNLLYADTYDRNMELIQNNGNFTNSGRLSISGNLKTGALLNNGTFVNEDSLLFYAVDIIGVHNTGNFTNAATGFVLTDTFSTYLNPIILTGNDFENQGAIRVMNGGPAFEIKANETFANEGQLHIESCNGLVFKVSGANALFHNMTGGSLIINEISPAYTTNPAALLIDEGELENDGKIEVSNTADPAVRVLNGLLTNNDSLLISQADALQAVYVHDEITNNGFLSVSGEGRENVDLFYLPTSSTFHNNGTVELKDAYQNGFRCFGVMTTTAASHFSFKDNTRNTGGTLLNHSNAAPLIVNGSMKAENSINCVSLQGAAENNGFLDLSSCSISMPDGTNNSGGHIISKDLSYIAQNDGVVEFLSTDAYSLLGTDVITNSGVMVDHGNAFRNIKFHDGGVLGFPLWNKGLFVSPFYGTLSDGIKEVVNLNFTETGTLPISDDWYTDRAKTTVAGTWHQTDHHYTPNAAAVGADSIFFEVNMSGSNPIVLSVPVILPTSCPSPEVIRIFQPVTDRNLADHTVWRGNRAPDYCNKIQLTGNEGFYLPSGYKMEINGIEIAPGVGPDRWVEIETGAVFEVNVLEFE